MTPLRGSIEGAVASTARFLLDCWDWAGQAVDSLVFPPYCPVCDADTGGPAFCPDCRAELLGASGPTCPRCAMPVGPYADLSGGCSECRGRPLGFDRAIALGPYQGPIRHLCLGLKHERNAWMARWLAELVVEGRSRRSGPRSARAGAWVVPVPLHWRRRLRPRVQPGRGPGPRDGPEALAEGPPAAPEGRRHADPGPGRPARAGEDHEASVPGPARPRP